MVELSGVMLRVNEVNAVPSGILAAVRWTPLTCLVVRWTTARDDGTEYH